MPDTFDAEQILDDAIAFQQTRNLSKAEELYRDLLEVDPSNSDALNLLGLILQDTDRVAESIETIVKSITIEPDFPEAFANLARGLNLLQRWDEALTAGLRACELDPNLAEGWQQVGLANLGAGRDQEALLALRKALETFPNSLEILTGIGLATHRLQDHVSAVVAWRAVLRARPDDLVAMVNLGISLAELEQFDEAAALHRRAVELAPEDSATRYALAITLHKRSEAAELLAVCRDLLARDPKHIETLMLMGGALIWLGQFDEAKQAFRDVLELHPDHESAAWVLATLDTGVMTDREISDFQSRFNDPSVPPLTRNGAGFVVGDALDRAGKYDAAFLAYSAANAAVLAELGDKNERFDQKGFRSYVRYARAAFTPTIFPELRPWGNPSELPVFIVGMPRSGTSLVEQIAASHSRVFGAGELRDIFNIITRLNSGPGHSMLPTMWDRTILRQETDRQIERLRTLGGTAERVINKLPDNIQYLGQISAMFPNARIIVCRRDLRDVCFSCFTTHFGDRINWSYDLEDIANRAVEVEHLLDHWRTVVPGAVLELSYETLVADLETESRRLIEFLGLEWEPACLDFHKNERQVTTASYWQVRQPLYTSSIGRWRRYEAHLGPMLKILEGYVPSDPSMATDLETKTEDMN